MGLRTPEQYLDGLRDGREVCYRGERVKVVPDHPELGVAARHSYKFRNGRFPILKKPWKLLARAHPGGGNPGS
jgi:hypothetical protein